MNLEAHRLRLLFVADEIPLELQRIIEFLNEHLSPMEVLGVQVRKYSSGDGRVQALGSTLVGSTAAAIDAKAGARGRPWDEASFLESLATLASADVVAGVWDVLEWARQHGSLEWGAGRHAGVHIRLASGRRSLELVELHLQPGGPKIWIHFEALKEHPAFELPERREELWRRLTEIPGVSLPPAEDCIGTMRSIDLEIVGDTQRRSQFLDVLEWLRDSIGGSPDGELLGEAGE